MVKVYPWRTATPTTSKPCPEAKKRLGEAPLRIGREVQEREQSLACHETYIHLNHDGLVDMKSSLNTKYDDIKCMQETISVVRGLMAKLGAIQSRYENYLEDTK